MLAYKNSPQNLGKKLFKPYNKRFIKSKFKKQLTSNKISFASRKYQIPPKIWRKWSPLRRRQYKLHNSIISFVRQQAIKRLYARSVAFYRGSGNQNFKSLFSQFTNNHSKSLSAKSFLQIIRPKSLSANSYGLLGIANTIVNKTAGVSSNLTNFLTKNIIKRHYTSKALEKKTFNILTSKNYELHWLDILSGGIFINSTSYKNLQSIKNSLKKNSSVGHSKQQSRPISRDRFLRNRVTNLSRISTNPVKFALLKQTNYRFDPEKVCSLRIAIRKPRFKQLISQHRYYIFIMYNYLIALYHLILSPKFNNQLLETVILLPSIIQIYLLVDIFIRLHILGTLNKNTPILGKSLVTERFVQMKSFTIQPEWKSFNIQIFFYTLWMAALHRYVYRHTAKQRRLILRIKLNTPCVIRRVSNYSHIYIQGYTISGNIFSRLIDLTRYDSILIHTENNIIHKNILNLRLQTVKFGNQKIVPLALIKPRAFSKKYTFRPTPKFYRLKFLRVISIRIRRKIKHKILQKRRRITRSMLRIIRPDSTYAYLFRSHSFYKLQNRSITSGSKCTHLNLNHPIIFQFGQLYKIFYNLKLAEVKPNLVPKLFISLLYLTQQASSTKLFSLYSSKATRDILVSKRHWNFKTISKRGKFKSYRRDLLRRQYGWASEEYLYRLKWFRKKFKRWFKRFRKIKKNHAFAMLLRTYFEKLTGYKEKQMLSLWCNYRRGRDSYWGKTSLVQKFSQTLLLTPKNLLLFLGLAPSRYVAKIMSNSGAIVINGVSSSIINRAVKPMDVIQLTPRVWDYIKNFYNYHRWFKMRLKLSLLNFLQLDWSLFLITIVRWPYQHELIAPSFLEERWVRYYIRSFPIRLRTYRGVKLTWKDYILRTYRDPLKIRRMQTLRHLEKRAKVKK